MPTDLPSCTDARDLPEHDGQVVRLIGWYRKSLTARKKGGPRAFRGAAHIELSGDTADYDDTAAPGSAAIVELGVRPADEIERLIDRRVRAVGTLVLDPYKEVREGGVMHAAVIFGPPQLRDVSAVELDRP